MKITVPHGVAARDELAASLGQRKSVTFFCQVFSQGNARDGVECAWRLATCFGDLISFAPRTWYLVHENTVLLEGSGGCGLCQSRPVKNGSEKVQIRVPENCGVGSALDRSLASS